jgi:acetylornithine deacetylase/succinyl-diaminopimelate desuccinylase-like protein
MELTLSNAGSAGPGFRIDPESAPVQLARNVLTAMTGSDPVYHWEGASIPIIPALATASGAAPLLVGFGHEDDHIHAPDESYSIAQFKRGFLYAANLLVAAARLHRDDLT